MRYRHLAAFVTVVVVVALTRSRSPDRVRIGRRRKRRPHGRCPERPTGSRTCRATGRPRRSQPLERPERLADQEFLSEEEAALLQSQLTAEGVDPLRRDAIAIEDPEAREEALYQDNRDASYVHYDNQVWLRTPVPKGLSTRRTSLVTHPPNGRIPPMTPEGAARVEAEAAMSRVFDGYETRPLMERCVVWTHEGPPLLPPAYNDIHQIFQTPDHFVLFTELATNPPRIMALDGRPGIPTPSPVRRRLARPLEGDTLVVETGTSSPGATTGVERVPPRRGALHARRRGHDPLRIHGHGSHDLDQPVERRGPHDPHRGPMFEYGVPRGQPRHPPHPRDQPQSRKTGGRGGHERAPALAPPFRGRRLTARAEEAGGRGGRARERPLWPLLSAVGARPVK